MPLEHRVVRVRLFVERTGSDDLLQLSASGTFCWEQCSRLRAHVQLRLATRGTEGRAGLLNPATGAESDCAQFAMAAVGRRQRFAVSGLKTSD